MRKTCQWKRLSWKQPPREYRCGKPAATRRREWRFGDETIGEPLVVKFWLYLCNHCAGEYDDRKAEGRAEALAS